MSRLTEMLKRHEGWRDTPYIDTVGVETVGYGHNLRAHPLDIQYPITREQGEQILDTDINRAVNDCVERIPVFIHLDETRRSVLVDMAFNLGISGLCGFHVMLDALAESQYDMAALAMRHSKWAGQVGARAMELMRMMETGEWEEDRNVQTA